MSQLWHGGECFLSTQSSRWQACTCCTVTQGQVLPVTPALSERVIAASRASPLLSPWFTPVIFFWVFTVYFYACSFMASSLPYRTFSRETCSLFFSAERHALVSPHTGIAGRVLPAGDWLELVSREVFRLMPDGSVKLAIISTAWIKTQEQKHHIGMSKILNIHMVSE